MSAFEFKSFKLKKTKTKKNKTLKLQSRYFCLHLLFELADVEKEL